MRGHRLRTANRSGLVESYIASYQATNSSTSYTFTGCNIGTPAANRTVVVGVTSGGTLSAVLSSATIGGSAATVHSVAAGRQITFGFASLTVTSGTTADISVTFSLTRSSGCAIFVYVFYGLTSNTVNAVADSGTTTTANTRSISLTPNAGDRLIAILFKSSADAATWTNATKGGDYAIGAGQYVGNAHTLNTASGAVTVTASWATSVSNGLYGGIFR